MVANIPPELFENILSFVGDDNRLHLLTEPLDLAARRGEMKHLSACAATCVYWARLTRWHMFEHIVVQSYKRLCG